MYVFFIIFYLKNFAEVGRAIGPRWVCVEASERAKEKRKRADEKTPQGGEKGAQRKEGKGRKVMIVQLQGEGIVGQERTGR